jgi:hypothetical protein
MRTEGDGSVEKTPSDLSTLALFRRKNLAANTAGQGESASQKVSRKALTLISNHMS